MKNFKNGEFEPKTSPGMIGAKTDPKIFHRTINVQWIGCFGRFILFVRLQNQ